MYTETMCPLIFGKSKKYREGINGVSIFWVEYQEEGGSYMFLILWGSFRNF